MSLTPGAKKAMLQRLMQNREAVIAVLRESKNIRWEWDAGGYVNELDDDEIALTGVAPGLSAEALTNCVTSLTNISAMLDSGDGTNLALAKA